MTFLLKTSLMWFEIRIHSLPLQTIVETLIGKFMEADLGESEMRAIIYGFWQMGCSITVVANKTWEQEVRDMLATHFDRSYSIQYGVKDVTFLLHPKMEQR